MNLANEFNQLTINYIKQTNLNYRKTKGQYFTPQFIRVQLINQLNKNIINPLILDPACGTGEFLVTASKYFNNPKLFGWEIDKNLITLAHQLIPQASLLNVNSLKYNADQKFDFIIGNPPYFEFKPDSPTFNKYKDVISGRPNIFSFFIKLGIDLLKDNGYLAYVVSPSMNNGAYFQKLRQYIIDHTNIEYLHIVENSQLFDGALQKIMLLILKKGKNKGNFVFKKNNKIIFSENPELLQGLFYKKKTLHELGYRVKTGRLVWNQNKKFLTNDSKQGVPLIWSSNIGESKLIFPLKHKPQFIKVKNYDAGPAIVLNRIVGSVKNPRLKAAIIPKGFKFIGENHVNVIYPPPGTKDKELKKIIKQLQSEECLKFICHLTGNTQISKTELQYLIPF